LFLGGAAYGLGRTLSLLVQLAHAVGEPEFPRPRPNTGRSENAGAIPQAEARVDFARRSRVLAWLLGGLNFQIEHHLLPRICHVNFPALSPIVEETCGEFGVRYNQHRTFRAGLASHFRWLRHMGSKRSLNEAP